MSLNKFVQKKVSDAPAPSSQSTLPIDNIQARAQDTRIPNDAHVNALAESIAAVGLIQPIAVDGTGRLLAGAHRLAAIKYLKQNDPRSFGKWFNLGIPVRRYDFDASADPDLALVIEATENEKRRDYTPTEVRELAERLKVAGYHHTQGRKKKDSDAKALLPSLATIVGKSERTIYRYLADDETPDREKVTDVRFSPEAVARQINKWLDQKGVPKEVRRLLNELAKELEDRDQ